MDVLGENIGFEVDLVAGFQGTESGDGKGVGDEGDAEPVRLAGDDGEADAVDGNGTFGRHFSGLLARNAEPVVGPVSLVDSLDEPAGGVDMAAHKVAAEAVAHRQCPFQVHGAADLQITQIRPREGLRTRLEGEGSTIALDDGETAAIDGDAVGHLRCGRDLGFLNDEGAAGRFRANLGNAAHGFDDSGKHLAFPQQGEPHINTASGR